MITQELVKELFDYDDGVLTWKIKPSSKIKIGRLAGFKRNGYLCTGVRGTDIDNHRIIFLWHHGYLPAIVDHIDGNKLNNRIDNLREATQMQNQQNSKLRKNNTSGVKGVHWHKQRGKWSANIVDNGKPTYLGLFNNIEDAKACVEEARQKMHGEFANHGRTE